MRNAGEARVQPLVLEVVAHVRDGRRRGAELQHADTVVGCLADGFRRARPRLHDEHGVAARAQAARQLVRAPAAAAADRRKGVGDEQDRSCG